MTIRVAYVSMRCCSWVILMAAPRTTAGFTSLFAFEFPGLGWAHALAANKKHHLTVNVTVVVWLTPPADPVTVNV